MRVLHLFFGNKWNSTIDLSSQQQPTNAVGESIQIRACRFGLKVPPRKLIPTTGIIGLISKALIPSRLAWNADFCTAAVLVQNFYIFRISRPHAPDQQFSSNIQNNTVVQDDAGLSGSIWQLMHRRRAGNARWTAVSHVCVATNSSRHATTALTLSTCRAFMCAWREIYKYTYGCMYTCRETETEREREQRHTTGWRRLMGCLIFIGHFPQNSPVICGSFAKKWPAS